MSFCSTPPPGKDVPMACYKDCVNWIHLILGLILMGLGIFGLLQNCEGMSKLLVVAINIYIFVLLIIVAIRSDGCLGMSKFLPHRLFALGLLVLLFIAVVSSFASMYIANGKVCQSGSSCIKVISRDAADNTGTYEVQRDGLYFSLVTMATVGYGDYTATDTARWLVIWQICSSLLLLVLAFPLLISRMATW